MSTARTIGRGVAWNFGSNVVEKGIVLANVLIILSYLSVYEYGLVELVFSAVSMVGIIMVSGISSAITADLGVERGRGDLGAMKSLFRQYALFLAIVSVAAFCALFFGAQYVADLVGNHSIGYFLQIASFTFLLSPLRTISILMATVHVRFVDQSVYPMLEELAKTAGLVLFFFVLHMGPAGLLYAVLLSQAAAIVAFLPRTYAGYRYFASATADGAHRFWEVLGTHRKWSIAAGYAGTLTQNAQLWIIKLMLGTEAVGLYAFASGIMSNVSALLPFSDVVASVAPKYAARRDMLAKLIATSAKAQFMVSLAVIVISALLVPVLVWFLPKYAPALPLTLLMLLVLLPTSIIGVYTPVFATLKKQLAFLMTMSAKLLLTLILMPLAILMFGIIGIGIGAVAVNTVSGIERYIRMRAFLPEYRFSLREFMRITEDERTLLLDLLERTPLRPLIGRKVSSQI